MVLLSHAAAVVIDDDGYDNRPSHPHLDARFAKAADNSMCSGECSVTESHIDRKCELRSNE